MKKVFFNIVITILLFFNLLFLVCIKNNLDIDLVLEYLNFKLWKQIDMLF